MCRCVRRSIKRGPHELAARTLFVNAGRQAGEEREEEEKTRTLHRFEEEVEEEEEVLPAGGEKESEREEVRSINDTWISLGSSLPQALRYKLG